MFVHVFAFRWKAGVAEAEKARAAAAILQFQGLVPGLIETHVGTNISDRGAGYSFAGVMKFADRAAFAAYGTNAAHVALLSWLMPLIDALELDFED